MKKSISLFLGLIIIFLSVGCSNITTTETTVNTTNPITTAITTTTTTTNVTTTSGTTTMSKLSTPTNILVVDNVITFTEIANANKYRITVTDVTEQLIGEYNITNGFDLSLLLSLGSYKLKLKATAPNFLDSDQSDFIDFDIIVLNQVNLLEGTDMNNLEYVRWMGRTYYDEAAEMKYFFFTASGFEVAFFGTELKVTFVASDYLNLAKQPHLVVLVDGEEDPTKGQLIVLDEAQKEVTVVSGLANGYHTVKVLKRSEAIDSDTSVKSIETDGYFTNPPEPKPFKLQFIAASSSTGFGNLGSLSEDKTTINSDGLRAYAYLTSFLLDAETSIFAASGWGVSRGWNTSGGDISETQNIPYGFEYTAIDSSNTVFTEGGKWDITNYIPDVIVINLGTNDFNASGYRSMDAEDQAEVEDRFKTDYKDFLILLNNMYPDALIIVAYGLMNEQGLLEDITLEIITEANTEIGEVVVYAFEMEGAGTLSNPYGSSYHPNVQTSMNVAEALADFISELTGREVVREMI